MTQLCPHSHFMSSPRIAVVCAVLMTVVLLTGCELHTLRHAGPFKTSNQHPVQLTALSLGARPARAELPGQGEASLVVDWSNMWLLDGDGADTVRFDGEWVRTSLQTRVGLFPGLDLEVGVPLMHASGGALDGFVEGWHDVFGLPDNDRSAAARDEFTVRASRSPGAGGATVYELEENGLHVGDIPLVLSWFPQVASLPESVGFGLRGGVELPTGDDDDGFGNGGVDVGLGLVGEWTSPTLGVYAWGEHVWVETPDRADDAGIDYADVPAAGCALQVGLVSWGSAIAQLEWERSVLRDLDQENASDDHLILWLGGRIDLGEQLTLDLAVGEDLTREVSVDVTIHATLSWSW